MGDQFKELRRLVTGSGGASTLEIVLDDKLFKRTNKIVLDVTERWNHHGPGNQLLNFFFNWPDGLAEKDASHVGLRQ